MSERELEFVGAVSRRRDKSDGWRSIGGLAWMASADGKDVQGSATHAAIAKAYHALGMVPPQDRLELLGG